MTQARPAGKQEAKGEGLFPPTDSQTPWRNKGRKPITNLTAVGHVESFAASGGTSRPARRRRLGVAATDEVVAIVDGAAWIRNQLERLGHCDHIGLDYYHFNEHVSEAARICFGEGSEQAAAWRKRVLGLALETGVDEVLDEIMQTCRRTRAPSKRKALRRLHNYVGERTAMIRYPQSRAKGWDIVSGPSEAVCKTTAARLKGSGMRWDPAGAQAMLQLTTLEDSNEWEVY